MNKAMEYIDTPLTKPSKLSIKQEVKKQKEADINRMSTSAIVWHLTYRHRVGLLVFSNIALIAYLVSSRLGLI